MTSLLKVFESGSIELISSFVSGPGDVQASGELNWTTIGGSFKADGAATIKLEIISFLTSDDCTGYVRLYDCTTGEIVNRVLSTTTIPGSFDTPQLKTSARFNILGGHIYMVQARCSGPVDDENTFVIQNVIPVNA